MNGYWVANHTEPAVKAMELEIAMDALQNCTHSEIREAYQRFGGNADNRTATNRLRKPDPFEIRDLIYASRPKPKPVNDYLSPGERAAKDAEDRRNNREKFDSDAIVAELASNMRVG